MAPAPHQRRLAVGIDLGTTNSLVAAVRNSIPEALPDDAGRVLLPSVVRYLGKGGRRIGHVAKEEAATDPRNTIVSVKRFMGRGKGEVEGAENAPYDVIVLDGATEIRPDQLYSQLREDGRLVGIFAMTSPSRAIIVTRSHGDFGSRVLFDASAPVLPGLERLPTFVF